jgi:hypothetical protein
MPKKSREKLEKLRKNFGVRLNRELMLEVQHIALDLDCFANDLIEEALAEIVKKYRDRKKP